MLNDWRENSVSEFNGFLKESLGISKGGHVLKFGWKLKALMATAGVEAGAEAGVEAGLEAAGAATGVAVAAAAAMQPTQPTPALAVHAASDSTPLAVPSPVAAAVRTPPAATPSVPEGKPEGKAEGKDEPQLSDWELLRRNMRALLAKRPEIQVQAARRPAPAPLHRPPARSHACTVARTTTACRRPVANPLARSSSRRLVVLSSRRSCLVPGRVHQESLRRRVRVPASATAAFRRQEPGWPAAAAARPAVHRQGACGVGRGVEGPPRGASCSVGCVLCWLRAFMPALAVQGRALSSAPLADPCACAWWNRAVCVWPCVLCYVAVLAVCSLACALPARALAGAAHGHTQPREWRWAAAGRRRGWQW
jgi:hypothetical protein